MLFKKKEIWVPTWKGWLAILLLFVMLVVGLVRFIVPFLAPNKPLGAPVLVVEGWAAEEVILRAIQLDNEHHYGLVITAGQEIEKGMDITHYGDYANLAASRLVALGFKGTNLVKVPAPRVPKDRTYHAAQKVHEYLVKNTNYREMDLLTQSVHARRSWYLYGLACAPDVKVGIIADPNPEFAEDRWWKTSNGVRIVLSEAIGYVYARLVFSPE
jgi:hypothetical protein